MSMLKLLSSELVTNPVLSGGALQRRLLAARTGKLEVPVSCVVHCLCLRLMLAGRLVFYVRLLCLCFEFNIITVLVCRVSAVYVLSVSGGLCLSSPVSYRIIIGKSTSKKLLKFKAKYIVVKCGCEW